MIVCDFCMKPGLLNPNRCYRCPKAKYCDERCQKLDWKNGHSQTCDFTKLGVRVTYSEIKNDPTKFHIIGMNACDTFNLFLQAVEFIIYPPKNREKNDLFVLGILDWKGKRYILLSIPLEDEVSVKFIASARFNMDFKPCPSDFFMEAADNIVTYNITY